ncbi:hypothetical protein HK100_000440 [Physocladia obscura]|uniref:ABC transporter domain-containing protein n=1 Tax=Physocladia obscura TaxID=109957 RepID=A0AAD5T9H3_9FUNG|nr:hypothetical protein HK100_000440 [Physocladia obscura]
MEIQDVEEIRQQPNTQEIYEAILQDAKRSSRYDMEDAKSMQTIVNMLGDPRADPKSPEFKHSYFAKAVRQYMNTQGMEFAKMPIAFRNLNVVGNALQDTKIPTVGSAVGGIFYPITQVTKYLKGASNAIFPCKYGEKDIIKSISGVLKPGECVLVIGRPGSGCSSLLRTFSNQVRSFKEIRGDIKYGGFSSKELHDKFRGEIIYVEEGDPHYPSLTVRQTLDFALNCKVIVPEIREKIVESTLKLYGLVSCQNTVVGDAMLRGVSGGEKKRVSLAEATVIGGSAAAFDGCTKGLDAASSLDFIKGLRAMADFHQRTVIASCYQASDAMFDLFDKVIVLADGYCTYFGPAKEAVPYFESLGFAKHPRDTAAEYLTTSASSGIISPSEFFESYQSSRFGKANKSDANLYFDEKFTESEKNHFVKSIVKRKKFHGTTGRQLNNLYAVTTAHQAQVLMRREIQIIRGNPGAIIMSTFFNLLMAVIVGSVFLDLPVNSAGAFTRGGAIYFSLLFNSVAAFAEIPKVVDGRTILYKHMAMALYRPSTHFLAQTIFDIIISAIRIMLFCIILYFMVGLQNTAAHFFTFYVTTLVSQQAFSYLLKIMGYLSALKHQAINNAAVILVFSTIYAGYMISLNDMKPWFKWIIYLNPLSYGFQTLMINEFEGLQLTCVDTSLVPQGSSYTNLAYQTCTLAGSIHGSVTTDGLAYLNAAHGFDTSMKWWNFLINIGLGIVYFIIDCVVLETVQHGKAGLSVKLFKSMNMKKTPVASSTATKTESFETVEIGGSEEELKALNTLTWTKVNYTVPHPKEKGKTLQLLTDVNGYSQPGTMTALMGSSGAGKTTLLDVIAQRKTIGTIEGEIWVGNSAPGAEYLKMSGYCEQMDVHNKESTVREALEFAAFLRQPASVPKHQKIAYVSEVISMLEMDSLADALVGDLDSGVGLSMEERKRLTIGVELVSKPKILFLDEPTSGLDAQAATNIIRLLRNLTSQGYALVVTIHQPSAMLFREFDRLLLLGRGGKTIYFGELGPECETILNYFERTGAEKCDPKANPAEYILDSIGAGTAKSTNTIDWFEAWKASPESAREVETIAVVKQHASEYVTYHAEELEKMRHRLNNDIPSSFYATSLVVGRMFRSYWRNPSYNVGRTTFQILTALIIGLTFYQCSYTPSGAQNRIFALFQTSTLGVVVIKLVIPMFMDQRAVALREQSQGAYTASAFSLAITTAEIPFAIIASTFFYLLFYWTVGLNATSDNAGYFYLILTVFTLFCVSFGQMLASAIPNYGFAAAIIPILTSILALFCGVTISYDNMPTFYKRWLYWVDPYHYLIEGMMTNDLGGQKITCDATSFVSVAIPSNTTCGTYFDTYLSTPGVPGSLVNASATGSCIFCPVTVGDDIFDSFGWSYSHRWRNFGILVGFWLFNRMLTSVFANRYKLKR